MPDTQPPDFIPADSTAADAAPPAAGDAPPEFIPADAPETTQASAPGFIPADSPIPETPEDAFLNNATSAELVKRYVDLHPDGDGPDKATFLAADAARRNKLEMIPSSSSPSAESPGLSFDTGHPLLDGTSNILAGLVNFPLDVLINGVADVATGKLRWSNYAGQMERSILDGTVQEAKLAAKIVAPSNGGAAGDAQQSQQVHEATSWAIDNVLGAKDATAIKVPENFTPQQKAVVADYQARRQAADELVASAKLSALGMATQAKQFADRVWNRLTVDGPAAPAAYPKEFDGDVALERAKRSILAGKTIPGGQDVVNPASVETASQGLVQPANLLPGLIGFGGEAADPLLAVRELGADAATGTLGGAVASGLGKAASVPVKVASKVASKAADLVGDNPLLAGIASGGVALANGASPFEALIAAGGAKEWGEKALNAIAGKTAAAGGRLAGDIPPGPVANFVRGVYGSVEPTALRLIAGQLPMTPFLLGTDDENQFKSLLAGNFVAEGLGAGVRKGATGLDFVRGLWSPDASIPDVRVPVNDYGVSDPLDEAHQAAMAGVGNTGNNFVQAVRDKVVGKNGELYVLAPSDYEQALDDFAKSYPEQLSQAQTDLAKGQQGFTLPPLPGANGGPPRTVAIVKLSDSTPGLAVGHEAFHVLEQSGALSPEELAYARKQALDFYGPDGVADYKAKYESLAKKNLAPGKTPRTLSRDGVASEILAEHAGAVLNSLPIAKLSDPAKAGTAPGFAKMVYGLVGRAMEKIGAKVPQLTEGGGSVKTPTGIEPSATVGHVVGTLIDNVAKARQLDEPVLNGSEKVGSPPPAEAEPAGEDMGPIKGAVPAEPKAAAGLVKGTRIGDIGDSDGTLVGENAKILEVLPNDQFRVEFTHPDTGAVMRGVISGDDLRSEVEAGGAPADPEFPDHPVTPDTPQGVTNPAKPETQPTTPPNVRTTAAKQNQFVQKADNATQTKNQKLFEAAAADSSVGTPFEIEHRGAVNTEDGTPDQIQRERDRLASESLEDTPSENPLKQKFQKIFAPFSSRGADGVRVVHDTSSGKTVFGLSLDKVVQNADIMHRWLEEKGTADPYYRSPQIVSDLQNYLENQSNGYKGDGGKLLLPPDTVAGTIPKVNKDYVPVPIPADRAQKLNNLMGYKPAKRVTKQTVAASEYFDRFAKMNGLSPTKTANGLVETNPYRAELVKRGFNPDLLNQATEQLRLSDITKVAKPRPDLQFHSGSTGIAKGGFMPDTSGGDAWPGDFPRITIHTTIASLKDHPDYPAAKAGDRAAAVKVVNDKTKDDRVKALVGAHPDAVVVPVQAREASGKNKLPMAYAASLAAAGLQPNYSIVQDNVVGHTGASAFNRMLTPPKFSGPVEAGRNHIIVDDVATSGSSLAALRRHIEDSGGKVVAASTLATTSNAQLGYGGDLAIKPETLEALHEKFDSAQLNDILNTHEIARSSEGLTNGQARYLLTFSGLDSLRDRLNEEGVPRGRGVGPGTVQASPGEGGEAGQVAFMPETPRRPQGNDETRKVAEDYAAKEGIDYAPHTTNAPIDENKMKNIADEFEAAKHDPNDAAVRHSYQALTRETKAQYEAMRDAGIKIEPYEGSGEPYANSKAMMADVRENKHLYFLKTEKAFGSGDEPDASGEREMLKPSGVKIGGQELLNNDLFRAVHDYFGHTAEGYEFGPRGELNAYLAHSKLFSPAAKPALAAETLAQNAWVNFGKHLRDESGSIAKPGEPGYVPPAQRPFGEQKNFLVGDDTLNAVDAHAAGSFMPPTSDEFKRWFGDSKVVDENGKPLVVYHGSVNKGVTEFDPNVEPVRPRTGPAGTYFTSDELRAHSYRRRPGSREHGGMTSAYLKMENPLGITNAVKKGQKAGLSYAEAKRQALEGFDPAKHDGYILKPGGPNHDEYFVMNPTQIKSATANNGNYDPTNPDIRFMPEAQPEYSEDPEKNSPSLYSAKASVPDRKEGSLQDTKVDADIETKLPLAGPKLPHSIPDAAVKLVHYSGNPGLTEVNPANMGEGHATKNDRRGLDASFHYVKGSPLGGDEPFFGSGNVPKYETTVSGARIYDGNADPLGYWKQPNRWLADQELVDKGYAGLAVDAADGRKVAKLFEPVPVERTENRDGSIAFMPPTDPGEEHVDRSALRFTGPAEGIEPEPGLEYGKVYHLGKDSRHHDIIEHLSFLNGGPLGSLSPDALEEEQGMQRGFLSSKGRFLTRREAYALSRNSLPHTDVDAKTPRKKNEAAPKTDTPEFRKWFGKSKAVDDDGNPRILYHGTASGKDFNDFNASGGIYLSENPEYASDMSDRRYLGSDAHGPDWEPPDGAKVHLLYLRAENPIDATPHGLDFLSTPQVERILGIPMISLDRDQEARMWEWVRDNRELIKRGLEDRGVDGLRFQENASFSDAGPANVWLAFGANQVKSAYGNSGAFDPTNSDIRFMPASPEEHLDEFKADTLKKAMRKPGWAILTANRESVGAPDHPDNIAANEALEKELQERKLPHRVVAGSYKGQDQGKNFLITGVSENTALKLGRKYGQESVLTPKGYVYQDGSYNPLRVNGTTVGDEALAKDGYTVLPDGTPFSADVNFSKRLQPDVRGTTSYKEMAKYLTPEERDKVRSDTARRMLSEFKELPADADFEAAARMGAAKIGWYRRAGESIQKIFGEDRDKFVSLLAALSPQQSVQENLHMATRIWKGWDEAGRPTDEAALRGIVEPLTNLNCRNNNSVRALQGKELEDIPETKGNGNLSGYKVESFRKNLMGDLFASTNDTWMAQFAGIPASKFGTKSGYQAFTAKIRRVADKLGLQPAEVQESIWSFFKTLTESTKVDAPAKAVLATLKHEDIAKTPEFYTELIKNPRIVDFLKERGFDASTLGADNGAAGQPTGLAALSVPEGRGRSAVLERIAARAQAIKNAELSSLRADKPGAQPTLENEKTPESKNPF